MDGCVELRRGDTEWKQMFCGVVVGAAVVNPGPDSLERPR